MREQSPNVTAMIPPECIAIKDVYRKSGLTVADIATAINMSVGTVHVALSGLRYRGSDPRIAVPSDQTLSSIALVLGLFPEFLRDLDRHGAADLLESSQQLEGPTIFRKGREAQVAASARLAVIQQVLGVFSAEELLAEYERRMALLSR